MPGQNGYELTKIIKKDIKDHFYVYQIEFKEHIC